MACNASLKFAVFGILRHQSRRKGITQVTTACFRADVPFHCPTHAHLYVPWVAYYMLNEVLCNPGAYPDGCSIFVHLLSCVYWKMEVYQNLTPVYGFGFIHIFAGSNFTTGVSLVWGINPVPIVQTSVLDTYILSEESHRSQNLPNCTTGAQKRL